MGNIGKMGNMFDQTRPLHSPNNDQHVNMLFLKLPRLPSRLHRLKPRQFGRRQIHSPNRCKGPISTSFRHFQKGTELKELEGSAQTIPFGQAQEGTAVRGSAHSLACVEETMDRRPRNLQPNGLLDLHLHRGYRSCSFITLLLHAIGWREKRRKV